MGDMEKLILGAIFTLAVSMLLMGTEMFVLGPWRRRRDAIGNCKTIFNALLVLFDENSIGFPLSAQDFLVNVYSVQMKAVLQAENALFWKCKKLALHNAWEQYYRYVINNDFATWLDERNRIPNDTDTGTFKARTRERIQDLLNVL